MDMIHATEKKLREAEFFYRRLVEGQRKVVRNEPEAFGFYLSAFLSAARAIPWVLQKEQKDKYESWLPQWRSRLTDADRALHDFMTDQRNKEHKETGSEMTTEMVLVPIVEALSGRYGQLPGLDGFDLSMFPDGGYVVGQHKHQFPSDGEEVLAKCGRYLEHQRRLVRDFNDAHRSAT